jgi:hypothetical protein
VIERAEAKGGGVTEEESRGAPQVGVDAEEYL